MSVNGGQRGFTLIELIVVIIILGILAAFAIPRFAKMDSQARTASRDALSGSVRSAAALSHALWLAQNQPANVTMEGQAIAMANGYPNRATVSLAITDFEGWTYDAGSGVFSLNALPTCTVTYTQAPANGAPTVVAGGTC